MSRVGIVLGRAPASPAPTATAIEAAPKTEYQAIVDETEAEMLHSGLAPSWARGSWQTRAAFAAYARRRQFDSFYCTSEDIGLQAGLLLRASGWKGRLVVVVHAIRSAKWKAAMKHAGRRVISDVICVSDDQRRLLTEETGFPAHRVHCVANWVDTSFFQSGSPVGDYVFSCGLENRDYATLVAAARMVDVPFVTAASGYFGSHTSVASGAPANFTVLEERVPWVQLRDLYGRSRFVVLPLNPVDYAAGVTGMVEACAMGKAVIATASPGIAEYVAEGESGLVVPPGDPEAMAQAIRTLYDDPERCLAMGRRNRIWAEKNADVAQYARFVSGLLHE